MVAGTHEFYIAVNANLRDLGILCPTRVELEI